MYMIRVFVLKPHKPIYDDKINDVTITYILAREQSVSIYKEGGVEPTWSGLNIDAFIDQLFYKHRLL